MWEKNGEKEQQIEDMEITDRAHNEEKVRGKTKTVETEIMANSPLTAVIPSTKVENS